MGSPTFDCDDVGNDVADNLILSIGRSRGRKGTVASLSDCCKSRIVLMYFGVCLPLFFCFCFSWISLRFASLHGLRFLKEKKKKKKAQ